MDKHIHASINVYFDIDFDVCGEVTEAEIAVGEPPLSLAPMVTSSERRRAVEETQNPYAPPKANIWIAPEKQGPGIRKVYSPAQGSLGAFLGGPLAGTYFVCMNFVALGNMKRAWLAAILGTAIAAATTVWNLFVPDTMVYYGIAIRIVPALIAWLVIAVAHFTKVQIVESTTLTFHSNRRVAGVVLLGVVIFAAVGLVVGHFLPHR